MLGPLDGKFGCKTQTPKTAFETELHRNRRTVSAWREKGGGSANCIFWTPCWFCRSSNFVLFKAEKHLRSWPSCTISAKLVVFSVHRFVFATQVLKNLNHLLLSMWNMGQYPPRAGRELRATPLRADFREGDEHSNFSVFRVRAPFL